MANTLLKGSQATSDNTIWGYTLHNHSIITQSSVNPNNKDGADDGTTITKDMMDTIFKAKQGDIRAQVKLATAYKHCSNGLSQSYESAMDWFLQAADRGNPLAQLQVGLLHQNGHGVPQDYVKTMKWYPKVANQGDAKAQFNAKVFHRIIPRQWNGISSPPTKDIIAQHNIASLYELGLGVAKDYSMAKEWYLKAADQGCVSSLIHLGDIFFYGRGDLDRFGRDVPRNFSEALEFYRKAGELGDATVQFQVGLLYNTGQGVKLDTIKAIEWYRKAAEQGHAMAKNRLEFLKTRGYRPSLASLDKYARVSGPIDDMLQTDEPQERVQALRPVYKTGTLATSQQSQSEIVHVDVQLDPSGREIILWEDILVAFKEATNVRHKTRILPFLKDASFRTLEPLRIAAVPNAVLDVYIDGQMNQTDTAATGAAPTSSSRSTRNPEYDPMEMANTLLKEFDIPTPPPPYSMFPRRSPQTLSSSTASNTTTTNTEPSSNTSSPVPSFNAQRAPQVFVEDITDTIIKAKQGDIAAQVKLGDAFETGNGGLPQDYQSAMDWFLQAANRGDATAQLRVGLLYDFGHGVDKDYTKAMEWYRKAADQGLARAQNAIGAMYRDAEGVPQDYSEAMDWFRKAANQGYADASIGIGSLHRKAQGVPQSYAKAMWWYLKAVEDDPQNKHAPFHVALHHNEGLGVPLDHAKALEWFLKAAKLGNRSAQKSLGLIYLTGKPGVPQDYSKALDWLLSAAAQKDTTASLTIGGMYDNGEGVERDSLKAMQWYIKAANDGSSNAQYHLGTIYSTGRTRVAKDPAKAMEWFLMAAKQGHADAKRCLEQM
ncbi:hypothetical protein BGX23_002179 [Mortierella sp. AD031]|nr:hypothetical protein BGX23_002179 [Mortierella sp. AD031]